MTSNFERLAKVFYRRYVGCLTGWSTLVGRIKLRVLGRAALGRGVTIRGPIRVKVLPGGRLMIGDGVCLQSGFRYNPVGSECVMGIWVGPKGRLEIESGAGLSGATIVCMEAVVIGRDTFVGGGTRIYDTDFHALDPDQRRRHDPADIRSMPVHIGRECFIGGYTMILKGVTVGDEAVIGAGSLVTKDVPPREVWAGNPARFVKKLRGVASVESRDGGTSRS